MNDISTRDKIIIVVVVAILLIGSLVALLTGDEPEPTPTAPLNPGVVEEVERRPATATPAQVKAYMQAYLTHSWQLSRDKTRARVEAAGGAPGTPGATPWYEPGSWDICLEQLCSQSVVSIADVATTPGSAIAGVRLRAQYNGIEQVFDATCRIDIGPDDGQFRAIACPGGDG